MPVITPNNVKPENLEHIGNDDTWEKLPTCSKLHFSNISINTSLCDVPHVDNQPRLQHIFLMHIIRGRERKKSLSFYFYISSQACYLSLSSFEGIY